MKKIISILITIFIIVVILSSIRPYWDKYKLTKDVESAAIYGTKHSISQIEDFLDEKNVEADRDISLEDFIIEKDDKNTVTIDVVYIDFIRIFGVEILELEFEIEATAHEIEEVI